MLEKNKKSAKPKFSFLLQHFYSCAPPEGSAFPWLVAKPTHLDTLTTGRVLLFGGTPNDKKCTLGCIPQSLLMSLTRNVFIPSLIVYVRFWSAGIKNSIYSLPFMQNSVRNRLIRRAPAMQNHTWKCWFEVAEGRFEVAEGRKLRQLQICTFCGTSVSAASHISGPTTPVLNWKKIRWSHSAEITPRSRILEFSITSGNNFKKSSFLELNCIPVVVILK